MGGSDGRVETLDEAAVGSVNSNLFWLEGMDGKDMAARDTEGAEGIVETCCEVEGQRGGVDALLIAFGGDNVGLSECDASVVVTDAIGT